MFLLDCIHCLASTSARESVEYFFLFCNQQGWLESCVPDKMQTYISICRPYIFLEYLDTLSSAQVWMIKIMTVNNGNLFCYSFLAGNAL